MSSAIDPSVDEHRIGDEAGLRTKYRPPMEATKNKVRPVVDPKAAELIAACPLVVLATTSADGTDASPRGGPPGFVRVLDEHHIAFADLSGNNRLDSYTNLVEHPAVGLLFLIPGLDDTLRVNGRAHITTDPDVLAQVAFDDARPKVAVVIEVDECFVHCAKALRRSGVWQPETWPATDTRPTIGEVLVDQFDLKYAPELIDADLESGYATTLWLEGGDLV